MYRTIQRLLSLFRPRGRSMSLLPGTLGRYRKGMRVFVETGTGDGGGIQEALDAGFELVFSIESNREVWLDAMERFRDHKNVHILLGNSGDMLGSVLTAINEPCVIFLDAHVRGIPSPLMRELSAVLQHPHANTLLIDDLRRYRDGTWTPRPSALTMLLSTLFSLEEIDNRAARNDVLVAVSRAAA